MDDIFGFEIHGYRVFIGDAHHPQAVDVLGFGGGIGRGFSGVEEPFTVRRKRKNTPVQISAGDHGAAGAGGAFHDPGVSGGEVSQAAGDGDGDEGGLHADHEDFGAGFGKHQRFENGAGDFYIVFKNAAVGNLLDTVLPRLDLHGLAVGQGFIVNGLGLEGDGGLFHLKLFAHAGDLNGCSAGEGGEGGRLDAVQRAQGDAGFFEGGLHGGPSRKADLFLLAVSHDGDRDGGGFG